MCDCRYPVAICFIPSLLTLALSELQYFEGYGWFHGQVSGFNAEKGFYFVRYEDGDREEFLEDELEAWLVKECPIKALDASRALAMRNLLCNRNDSPRIVRKPASWINKAVTGTRAVRFGKPAPRDNSLDDVFEWDGSLVHGALQPVPKSSGQRGCAAVTGVYPYDSGSVDDEYEWDGSLEGDVLHHVSRS